MALHLNLLHEEIREQRQRQRDPLKIGMMVLGALGALMLAYYLWNAYKALEIRNRLSQAQHEWTKVEPKVTAAQKRSAELNSIISTTKVLDGMIDGRFFWAPLLEKLSRCVALNAQLTNIDGMVLEDGKISISIEGLAAGREPRAAAEELRQLLLEQLGQSYNEVKVEFRALEDLDTIVNIGGSNMAMARFSINATFYHRCRQAFSHARATKQDSGRTEVMKQIQVKLNKDQIQKLMLSTIGFIVLVYVYFSFFLGPLNNSRDTALAQINDLQGKVASSKSEMTKTANLEKQADASTKRFAALKALSPEGAPIAWFPPRMKTFFANQEIDKATARLENSAAYKEADLANWMRYNWLIELPQSDFSTLGKAIAALENAEPLLSITRINIKALPEDPQFQQVTLSASTAMVKR